MAEKALPIFILLHDTSGIINTYSSIGISYSYGLKYKTALDYFLKGLKMAEKFQDRKLLVLMLNDVAYIYNVQEEYEKALPLLLRTISMRKSLPNELPVVMGYINISTIYYNLGSNNKALAYLDTAFNVAEKWRLNHIKQAVYQRRGIVFNKMGLHEKAIKNLRLAIKMQGEMNNTRGQATSLVQLANVFLGLNKLDSANYFYDKGLEVAKSFHFLDIISDIYKGKSETLKKQGKFEESIKFLTNHHILKDSLTNKDVSRMLGDIESKYKIAKKEQEIIHHERIISSQKKALISLISLLIVTIVILTIAIFQYQQKNRASKILAKTNLELTKKELIIDVSKPKLIHKNDETIKYTSSSLDEIQKEELLEKLLALMDEKKPFLNPDITLALVAEELEVYPRYVSQIINEKFEKNFYNFINEYRVKEARILLINKAYENYSIEGIANSVGFNSKSSFNTFFKKITGITPSYFRESALK
ncbi:MAG: helix-turn-helix domain-containing protein [Flavobacteriia bacterium]